MQTGYNMSSDRKNTITKKAYAKVNLGLDVIRRREDGYHEVRMIMQTVDICDVLTFTRQERPGIVVTTDKEELPGDESNLIYKAARLVTETCSVREGIKIELQKRIPMAAGMAGGSTDAAAVFHGMNEMFGLGMDEDEMCALGVKIGADIPYCVKGGTALAEGIGEILTKLPDAPACVVLVAKPDIDVSTKYVYENLHAESLEYHPDIDGMRAAIEEGDLRGMAERMGNVLETVTVNAYPVIREIKEVMKKSGAWNALMSGSGPTVFGIFGEEEKARKAYNEIAQANLAGQLFLTGWAERNARKS
ncbi:4-(cytidine 5'-diphospho)-2-C-methyl-D-erythritol kinase [Lachnospiraceae bacterium 28-4]|nr:4-(cytidine 5'-diphospho)-2-C-methyl-D-erythritol kinase [Lachnospiraceae bacterium 28-4]